MFYDKDNNNLAVCEYCLRSAVSDTSTYRVIQEALPDCEMDGGTSYSNSVDPGDCACWSCQAMAEILDDDPSQTMHEVAA